MVRLKHRYIICQCLHDPMKQGNSDDDEYNAIDLKQQILEKMLQLWGDMICSSGLTIKGFDYANKTFAIRISRDLEIQIRMALSSITHIKKKKLTIRILIVAGSSRMCLMKYRDIMQISIAQQSTENERNKQQNQLSVITM